MILIKEQSYVKNNNYNSFTENTFSSKNLYELEKSLSCQPIFLKSWPRPQEVCSSKGFKKAPWEGVEVFRTINRMANLLDEINRYTGATEMSWCHAVGPQKGPSSGEEGPDVPKPKAKSALDLPIAVAGSLATRWNVPLKAAGRLRFSHVETARRKLSMLINQLQTVREDFREACSGIFEVGVAEQYLAMRLDSVQFYLQHLLEMVSVDAVRLK